MNTARVAILAKSIALETWAVLVLCAACLVPVKTHAEDAGRAVWFPDQTNLPQYQWIYQPCQGCKVLQPRPEWRLMASLAGKSQIKFILTQDEIRGPAYSMAPDVIVLTPAALEMEPCHLAFVIGHEIAHIAQRHFDEDAAMLAALEGKNQGWTYDGETALSLLEGNFALALRMSDSWQQQEHEADWIGSLLAAQACGCELEEGALPYLVSSQGYGGGLLAAHQESNHRAGLLKPFAESAKRLAKRDQEESY